MKNEERNRQVCARVDLDRAITENVIAHINIMGAKIPRDLIEVATRTPRFHASFDYGGVHVLIPDPDMDTATVVYLEHVSTLDDRNFQDLTVATIDMFGSIKAAIQHYQSAIFNTALGTHIENAEYLAGR